VIQLFVAWSFMEKTILMFLKLLIFWSLSAIFGK